MNKHEHYTGRKIKLTPRQLETRSIVYDGNRYRDEKGSLTELENAKAAIASMHEKIPPHIIQNDPNILEIGSGYGRVTKALKDKYPSSTITAYDYSSDHGIRAAARANHIDLIQRDIRMLGTKDLEKLILERNILYISALRTSASAANHVTIALDEIGFTGVFGFSVILESEREEMEPLYNTLHTLFDAGSIKYSTMSLPVPDTSDKTDVGYLVTFPRAKATS